MKRNLLLVLLCMAFNFVHAQGLDITTKDYDGGSIMVIKPSISTFITLLNYNEAQFRAAMERCQYSDQPPRGPFITYWNGSNDNFAFAKSVNTYLYNKETSEVHFAVGTNLIYPQGSIAALYHELRPFEKREQDVEKKDQPVDGDDKAQNEGPGREHRRGWGRGFNREPLSVYELPIGESKYEFRIAAYPRFFYIVVRRL